ncbi:MAG: rRNA pseudouridine synthase [Polyangiaceae bacterium]|nr:rRNA pseudouridine synthase [Polyangiaceae bacterium]
MPAERLQKILALAGLASRRGAEQFILDGRVRVDGEVISELGTKADPRKQRIEVDGTRIFTEPLCYGVMHKPRGMLTSLSDPEGRATAQDILKEVGVRVVPVGRLDYNTSGVLLFTNDGDFAEKLGHARSRTPKVYAAKLQSSITEAQLEKWRESIEIDGQKTRPAEVRVLRKEGEKTWLEITLQEGRNRQIRRLGDHAGTPVVRHAPVSQAGVAPEAFRPGQWRLLTIDELKSLKSAFGVPEKIRGLSQDADKLRRAAHRSSKRKILHPGSRKKTKRKGTASPASSIRTRSGAKSGMGANSPRSSEASSSARKGNSPERRTNSKRGRSSEKNQQRPQPGGRQLGGRPQKSRRS